MLRSFCFVGALPLFATCSGAHGKSHHAHQDLNVGKGHRHHPHSPMLGKRLVDARKWSKRWA